MLSRTFYVGLIVTFYEASRYLTLFQKTAFKNRCAVITSYNQQAKDIIEAYKKKGVEAINLRLPAMQ